MRIGLPLDMSKTAPDLVEQARGIVDGGFAAGVASQIFGPDTLTMLAVVGAQVPDLELVTSVVPTWPRHPVMLAAQALTVSAITGGRLTLGIGLSHQIVVENVFGTPFVRPAQHMKDYLAVLNPLLRGEQVSYKGETLSANTFGPLEVKAPTPPVLVAALGSRMLALAGREADGTATWMTGPATLEAHIIPSIRQAAADAGRPAPRIAAGLPMAVTADPDAARERAARAFSVYGTLPSYQAMLAREGAGGPADVAIVGDEATVADQVRHLAAIGVTDLHAAPFGPADEVKATIDLLGSLLSEVAGPS
jgi:5,10-methylenetetrahydromethanopterin reductase